MSNDTKLDKLRTEDGVYETTFTEKYKKRIGWSAPDQRKVLSYIPGTITQMCVKVGQKVAKGETLLMFNAMKMSNSYGSPMAGKIAKINVQEGQAVAKGVVLVEFE